MQVLVSLHDVTPAHQARLEQAEALLASVGVSRVAYLLVPEYHGAHPIEHDQVFGGWCRRARPFAVDWVLHGYYHREDSSTARAHRPLAHRFARRLLTAGEGEYLALDATRQRERLARGRDVVSAVTGVVPAAFVPPAWLSNDALAPALRDLGFRYTEDHWRIFDVRRGDNHSCPVITWATRSVVRRVGSRVVCPMSLQILRWREAIRVAIHPFDMDHPKTAEQIRRLLGSALERRRASGYDDLFTAG